MVARRPSPGSDLPTLVLRAEGGPGIGAGHQARCLALGQAWIARRGAAVLVADVVPEPWRSRYVEAGIEVVPVDPSDPWLHRADVWLVDGYDLPVDPDVVAAGTRHARVDDHALSPADPVDLLVDQNLGASAAAYEGRSVGRLLLGLRYALLRADLVAAADAPSLPTRSARSGGDPPHLLVMQGGAPTSEVRSFFDAVVSQLDPDELRVTILDGMQDPVPALASADLAIAPSGSSAWELCAFGIPSLLVAVAPNQEPLGEHLASIGAAVYAGPLQQADPTAIAGEVRQLARAHHRLADLADVARGLIDGRGAARVATGLRSLLVALRPAEEADAERIWTWNNDPLVRSASVSTDPIPWDHHLRWFASRLADPSTPIFVAADHLGRELGVVRFEIEAGVFPEPGLAEIGVALAADRRGEAWGAAVIDAACRRILGHAGVDMVVARIKPANRASIDAFGDADFDAVDGGLDSGVVAGGDGMRRYARRVDREVRLDG